MNDVNTVCPPHHLDFEPEVREDRLTVRGLSVQGFWFPWGSSDYYPADTEG